jgi:hypothetical protein
VCGDPLTRSVNCNVIVHCRFKLGRKLTFCGPLEIVICPSMAATSAGASAISSRSHDKAPEDSLNRILERIGLDCIPVDVQQEWLIFCLSEISASRRMR